MRAVKEGIFEFLPGKKAAFAFFCLGFTRFTFATPQKEISNPMFERRKLDFDRVTTLLDAFVHRLESFLLVNLDELEDNFKDKL